MPFDTSSNLGRELFLSLRSAPFRSLLKDYGLPRTKNFSRGLVLSLSLLLSKEWPFAKGSRIGVVLPPGIGGFVTNFALLLSGRIPVNLNFTLGNELNREILEDADLVMVITASKLVDKFPDFPWPKNCFLVDQFFSKISRKRWRIIVTFLHSVLLPKHCIQHYGIPNKGGDQVATILYTSGSSGKPKGVLLSHANLLANCKQLYGLNIFHRQPKVLVNLPLFHSFGLTVGMLFTTLRKLPLSTAPSPLDHKINLKIIVQEKIEILLGTPTFLRGYLRVSKPGMLSSIRYVVAGAEKSPESFRQRWEREAECQYLEGYGLTEASPAISFNLPGEGKKSGSVGRLLPEVECRVHDQETGRIKDLQEGGVLCFRGPNIFSGYWRTQQKTREVLDDAGWFKTGDLGRIDEEGFLWIEGRCSRFSKIGGEMIPHGRIEEEIIDILGLCTTNDLSIAIISVSDEKKGERLILFSSVECDLKNINHSLKQRGVSNLWMPKELILVNQIPVLSTGKINWPAIRSFVEDKKSS